MRLLAALLLSAVLATSALADTRSKAARAEFHRQNPCPTTGETRGSCPGHQVDHIKPRCAGGADAPANMQWLTIAEHKEKTRGDVAACRVSRVEDAEHGGGLNACGCHFNRKTGEYHCHARQTD